jgi:pimeloyl-ACP methyl ester carboxylesterase
MIKERQGKPGDGSVKHPRVYGKTPYRAVLVHGGPGVAGEMAPVALELSAQCGVIEPFQTADSVEGQITELSEIISTYGESPAVLAGFSWGAWLCFLLTARYPGLVRKLILIGGGPFEEQYAGDIHRTRILRLGQEKRKQAEELMAMLDRPAAADQNEGFSRFGTLLADADAFDPDGDNSAETVCDLHIFQHVWPEAARLRQSGQLLDFGKYIQCPVVAIHGDWDPHPAEGVREPLSRVLKDFRFILLKKCGHRPWVEKQAGKQFYRILKEELALQSLLK